MSTKIKKSAALLAAALCLLFSSHANAAPQRIVSLAPNVTEILFALGLEDRIAAVTSYCDYPAKAKLKPKVGGMSNPSLESVIALNPDLVIMNTDGNPREFHERLSRLGLRSYVFRARRLADLPAEIRSLGRALGADERAQSLAGRLEKALSRKRPNSSGGKVLFVIQPEPLIAAGDGTEINDALRLLGWQNIAADTGSSYAHLSIEEILQHPPDVILIGKGHADMMAASQGLLKRLQALPAVRQGRVYYTSDALFRLGPRVIEGIEELERILQR